MRKHNPVITSRDDPTDHKIGWIVSCEYCGSRTVVYFDWSQMIHNNWRLEQSIREHWDSSFPADCDEARLLNAVRKIHED